MKVFMKTGAFLIFGGIMLKGSNFRSKFILKSYIIILYYVYVVRFFKSLSRMLARMISWTIVEGHNRDRYSVYTIWTMIQCTILLSIEELYGGISCTHWIHSKNGNTMSAHIIAVLYSQSEQFLVTI